jgi:hypothetical protein
MTQCTEARAVGEFIGQIGQITEEAAGYFSLETLPRRLS